MKFCALKRLLFAAGVLCLPFGAMAQVAPGPGRGPTCPGIMLSPIASVAAGTSATISGVYCDAPPTGIDYSLDGRATWTASTTPTISGNLFSFSLTAPGGGTYTVYTREEPGTGVVSNAQAWVVTGGGSQIGMLVQAGVGLLVQSGVGMLVQ